MPIDGSGVESSSRNDSVAKAAAPESVNTKAPILAIKEITQEFFGVKVLDSVSFSLEAGEVLGIIGGNGAGKSALLKIIAGIHTPGAGFIELEGRKASIPNPGAALARGIVMVPQECNLSEDLNVFENIFLGREPRRGVLLDQRAMRTRAGDLLNHLKIDVSPTEKIENLNIAQKRMVEFAKALSSKPRLVILDEISSAFTSEEVDRIFDAIRYMKAQGVGVLYVSHRLEEVKAICDRVAILRDGVLVSVDDADDLDVQTMAARMAGQEPSRLFPDKVEPYSEVVLEVRGLRVEGTVSDVGFDLRKGEILGFAGLLGAGRTTVAEALMGLRRKRAGTVRVKGNVVEIDSPDRAVRSGFSYLPEDRRSKGILFSSGIVQNITLGSLSNYCSGFFIDEDKEYLKAEDYVEELKIRAASLFAKLEYFSGGNQQKVSLAKSADLNPIILIVDEPTRGVDVNSRREIYRFIKRLTDKGSSCIFISSEADEIAGMCDRAVVMRCGRVAGILEGKTLNEKNIMLYATGLLPVGKDVTNFSDVAANTQCAAVEQGA
jgi:ribose transport system ATP-binding protein